MVPEGPFRTSPENTSGYYEQAGPNDYRSTYERRVGGSTWHWLETMRPNSRASS